MFFDDFLHCLKIIFFFCRIHQNYLVALSHSIPMPYKRKYCENGNRMCNFFPTIVGRCPGAHLHGWVRAGDPWRDRDGPGSLHQDDPGGRPQPGHPRGPDTHSRDQHGQGAQHIAHRCQHWVRSQREGC